MNESATLSLGDPAPDFCLPDVVLGSVLSLASFAQRRALLVMFIGQHCPYVKHLQPELTRLGRNYLSKGVGIVAVCSNDARSCPEDDPKALRKVALELPIPFPLCHDESQETAKAYTVTYTPDFFLFDSQRKLVYRGQFDDSRPGNGIRVSGHHLRTALDNVLGGRPVSSYQKPSTGGRIRWKPGNEPVYVKG